jgi:hypothetical protein
MGEGVDQQTEEVGNIMLYAERNADLRKLELCVRNLISLNHQSNQKEAGLREDGFAEGVVAEKVQAKLTKDSTKIKQEIKGILDGLDFQHTPTAL